MPCIEPARVETKEQTNLRELTRTCIWFLEFVTGYNSIYYYSTLWVDHASPRELIQLRRLRSRQDPKDCRIRPARRDLDRPFADALITEHDDDMVQKSL